MEAAPTWAAMLAYWADHGSETAIMVEGASWSGLELLQRAAGAADDLQALAERDAPIPRS